ncbi:MAG TPA: SAM-dependent chlorinase/fluorinase [Thermotogota bacterium]|nr:SAM-dependent chlorinase/fluorinase [Thermotogota bacterium]HRW92501.1 SAM-dependent chlorinase/fluorinase [Thermotogota bacterium]
MLKKGLLFVLMCIVSAMLLAAVAAEVVEVDKYGNVHTNVPEQQMLEAGYEVGDMLQVSAGGNVWQAPFVTTYGDVDRGNPLVRISGGNVLLAINYGNCSKTYGLDVGTQIEISLVEKGVYLEELEIRHLVRTDVREDYETDAIFANFRGVVMGNIAPGKLYRTSHPSIDDPRSPFAADLMEQAGIKTVINLSDSSEELQACYAYNDYYSKLGEEGQIINLNMGVDLLSDEFAQKLYAGLLFMTIHQPPYLVHCVEGKDRAGMVVAILGAIMDANTDEIFHDYVVSYENYYHVKPDTLAYTAVEKIIADIFREMNGGQPVDDSNVKQVAMKYLTEKVGLTPEQISDLQQKLQ